MLDFTRQNIRMIVLHKLVFFFLFFGIYFFRFRLHVVIFTILFSIYIQILKTTKIRHELLN